MGLVWLWIIDGRGVPHWLVDATVHVTCFDQQSEESIGYIFHLVAFLVLAASSIDFIHPQPGSDRDTARSLDAYRRHPQLAGP